ncbi:hypothetical protein [Agrococcus sp. SGAir0287]|uniref:hypothetical protein n=1 Tax=Agrococcus sp. SGAir0287 TaxID=2070347 RepID=UPI0010CCECF3|nr:hypothetical protein [Agrococcus sp. SGAir0287]QCR20117.1 hypothetical protein C1N71_12245 [Agrococcus sp. SGAir0287]
MLSPRFQYPLEQFDGEPGALRTTAQAFVDLGATMGSTADALQDVADSDVHRSMGTDALAEEAEGVVEDLRKAAIRYAGTGEALLPYAAELLEARLWYVRNADELRTAETAHQQALLDRDSALMSPVEDQADAVSEAQSAIDAVEGTRDALWTQWETVVDDWSSAYETAADGIAEAMDAADNDDSWWDAISDALTIIGWVIVVLAVVALFVVAKPWASIIFWSAMALSAIHLAGTVYLYANGKKSMSDVLLSAFGLVTLGMGGVFTRAAPGLSTLDEVSTIARLAPNAPAGVTRLPSILSPRSALVGIQYGDDVARLSQYADDLVRLGAEGGPNLTRTLGTMIGDDVAALGLNAPALVEWSAVQGTAVLGNLGLLPSFGRP